MGEPLQEPSWAWYRPKPTRNSGNSGKSRFWIGRRKRNLLALDVGLNLLSVKPPTPAHLEGGKAFLSAGFLPLCRPGGDGADGEPEHVRHFFSLKILSVGLDHSLSPIGTDFFSIGEWDDHFRWSHASPKSKVRSEEHTSEL